MQELSRRLARADLLPKVPPLMNRVRAPMQVAVAIPAQDIQLLSHPKRPSILVTFGNNRLANIIRRLI